MDTLTAKEQLLRIEDEIIRQEPIACAEKAFNRANSTLPNPFAGAADKLQQLILQKEDLRLEQQGKILFELLAKKTDLEGQLNRLSVERQVADRALAELAANPTVVRYKNAASICMQQGWGHSWELFRQFFQSNRSLREGCHDSDPFFLHDEKAKEAGVMFSLESDRPVIHRYNEAKSASDAALIQWNDVASRLRDLLREHPELGAVA